MSETAQFITARLPTRYGEFRISVLPQDGNDKRGALVVGAETLPIADKEHVVLAMGDLAAPGPAPLLRLHSECLTGDALHSLRCDCGFQLEAALSMIAAEGRGVILYLRQEGRGIGLVNKLRAYALQDQGQDTVEANVSLGFGPDQRDYSDAITLLRALNLSTVRLMTNNPRKVKALEDAGINVTERVPMKFGSNPHNFRYLEAKSSKLGHLL